MFTGFFVFSPYGWLESDPFTNYKITLREVERACLTEAKFDAAAAKHFSTIAYAKIDKKVSNDILLLKMKFLSKEKLPLLTKCKLAIINWRHLWEKSFDSLEKARLQRLMEWNI